MEPQFDMPGGNGHPIDCDHKFIDSASCLKCGWTPEPVQATLPGVRPVFDVWSALDSIEECEKAASAAGREYTSLAEKTKTARKYADLLNTKLRAMIQSFAERRHDARYEPPDEDEQAADAGDVSVEGDAHAVSGGVSGTVGAGEPNAEDTSTAPVSDVSAVGDLGTAPEAPEAAADLSQDERSDAEPVSPSSDPPRAPRGRRRAR